MSYLAIIFTSVFLSNIVLSSLVGMPIFGKSTKLKNVVLLSLKTIIVSVITTIILFPINKYLIEDFVFLLPLTAVLLAAVSNLFVNVILNKVKLDGEVTSKFDLLSQFNAVIFGIAIITMANAQYLDAIITALGLGLGFLLINVLAFTIKPRLDLPGIPKAFKGLPILLITLGLIGMVFLGLAGIF